MYLMHDDILCGGHVGISAVYTKVAERFYWKNMYMNIKNYVQSCKRCAMRKRAPHYKSKTKTWDRPDYPWQVVQTDYIGPLRKAKGGYLYILTFIDLLTGWPEAFPTKDCTAATTAAHFLQHIVCRYGKVKILNSDRGPSYVSKLFREVTSRLMTQQQFTSSRMPQGNARVERLHKTLQDSIGLYVTDNHETWPDLLPLALWNVRSTISTRTGFSPYSLLYGRDNAAMGFPEENPAAAVADESEWFIHTKHCIEIFDQVAKDNTSKYEVILKGRLDKNARPKQFEEGDLVYYYDPTCAANSTSKFSPRYRGPYRVEEVVSDNRVMLKSLRTGKFIPHLVNISKLKTAYERDPTWEVVEDDGNDLLEEKGADPRQDPHGKTVEKERPEQQEEPPDEVEPERLRLSESSEQDTSSEEEPVEPNSRAKQPIDEIGSGSGSEIPKQRSALSRRQIKRKKRRDSSGESQDAADQCTTQISPTSGKMKAKVITLSPAKTKSTPKGASKEVVPTTPVSITQTQSRRKTLLSKRIVSEGEEATGTLTTAKVVKKRKPKAKPCPPPREPSSSEGDFEEENDGNQTEDSMTPDSEDQEGQDLRKRQVRKAHKGIAHRTREDISKCKQLQKREEKQNDVMKQWSAVRAVTAALDSEDQAEQKKITKIGIIKKKEHQLWNLRKEKENLQNTRRVNAAKRDARMEQRLHARDLIAQKGAKVISEDEISEKEIESPKLHKPKTRVKKAASESEESSSGE